MRRNRWTSMCLIVSIGAIPAAHAQWAVIDVGAIAQLIQEVQTCRRQLHGLRSQLDQAKLALDSMSGNRGMQLLLGGTVRNYLPTSSTQLFSASQGSGGYPGLASDVRTAVSANAVMSTSQLATLP